MMEQEADEEDVQPNPKRRKQAQDKGRKNLSLQRCRRSRQRDGHDVRPFHFLNTSYSLHSTVPS